MSVGSILGGAVGFAVGGPVGMLVGSGIGSGYDSAQAAESAARAQASASDRAAELQNAQYLQNRADLAPWRDVGKERLYNLRDITAPGGELLRSFTAADFEADPGFAFRQTEGEKAINRSAAAKGNLFSGQTLKELLRYNQDYASGEYTNAFNRWQLGQSNKFNRLAALSGVGQQTAMQLADQGAQTARTLGDLAVGAGNARAAGIVGSSNAYNKTFGNLSDLLITNSILKNTGRGIGLFG